MKIAIVGTSELTEAEKLFAEIEIGSIIIRADPSEIITGDAKGIDEIARNIKGVPIIVCTSKVKSWEGRDGFKHRNIRIAQLADYVYSISTKIKKTRCYHCDTPNHERTGGCWTKRFAIDKLGKKGVTIVI